MKTKKRSVLRHCVDGIVGMTVSAADAHLKKRLLLQRALTDAAVAETVAFIRENAPEASYFPSRLKLLSYAIDKVRICGLYIELGVHKGITINHIAEKVKSDIHGFDSFEGLPSSWTGTVAMSKKMDRGGATPPVSPNVVLHKGWFHETLPSFLESNPGPVAFLHVDCVIYESTKTALELLAPRLIPGTVIVFDEYFGYWGWRHHEHKAFEEFLVTSRLGMLGFGISEQQLAIKLTDA